MAAESSNALAASNGCEMENIIKLIVAVFLIASTLMQVQAVSVIGVDQSSWTCFDYSTAFAKDNPGWSIVTISDDRYFRGVSHMVNYQLTDDDTMLVHDGLYNADYIVASWRIDTTNYYHFWVNGQKPVRNYRMLFDNRRAV